MKRREQGEARRVRILFTIPNFITAGSGRAMLNIVERLDRSSFEPAVCVSRLGGRLDDEVRGMGIPLIEAPFTVAARPYHSLPMRARAAGLAFRGYRFDVWHSFHYSDDYTEPIIARLSGAGAWIFTKKNMGWGSRAWFLRSLLASRIVALNSDMLTRYFARWPLRRRVRFIPRGVDANEFRPDRRGSIHRRQLGISDRAVIAVCVAHLVPLKGHPTLITAVAEVPGLHLLVAGKPLDQEYSASLEQHARELGIADRIHFLGGVADVSRLLNDVDIAVLPTREHRGGEGCPVAVLEAMAVGRACIASDVPGSRDLIEHDESGFLVPPDDSHALSSRLAELARCRELRDRLGNAARQRVLDRYTIEREVTDHVALYREIRRAG